MTKYEIILYWSDENQSFNAEVPELAGCAADGATHQEALANVEVVIGSLSEADLLESNKFMRRVDNI